VIRNSLTLFSASLRKLDGQVVFFGCGKTKIESKNSICPNLQTPCPPPLWFKASPKSRSCTGHQPFGYVPPLNILSAFWCSDGSCLPKPSSPLFFFFFLSPVKHSDVIPAHPCHCTKWKDQGLCMFSFLFLSLPFMLCYTPSLQRGPQEGGQHQSNKLLDHGLLTIEWIGGKLEGRVKRWTERGRLKRTCIRP